MAKQTAYPPLTKPNSTRLLKLEPCKHGEGRLKGILFEVDLIRPPPFDAISYVWGSRKDTGSLLCATPDGHQAEVKFTGNGEDAIRRMRRRSRSRLLWIDAICINQNNVSERNQQVAIMASIYSKAKNVLVWLPDDDKEKWKDLNPTILRRYLTWIRFVRWIPFLIDSPLSYFYRDNSDLKWEVDRIASSSWFEQVWTLLEYAFARNCLLYYSDKSPISATYLSGNLRGLRDHKLWNTNPFREDRVRGAVRSLALEIQGQDILFAMTPSSCIANVRSLQATQAVDHVFALYPIFSSHPRAGNWIQKPDYSKSKEQVFREVAVKIIQQGDSAHLLSTLPAVEEPNFLSSWPSWVPDYAIPGRSVQFFLQPHFQRQKEPKFYLSQDLAILKIGGFLVDRVLATLPGHPTIQNTSPDRFEYPLKNKIEAWLLVLRWYCLALKSSCLPAPAIAAHFFHTFSNMDIEDMAPFILYLARPLSSNPTEISFGEWYEIFRASCPRRYNLWDASLLDKELDTFFAQFGVLRVGDLEDHAKALANLLTLSETVGLAEHDVPDLGYPWTEQYRSLLLDDGPFSTIRFNALFMYSDNEFFVTKSGYTGITNGYVQEGDLVVLVPNLSCPTVLREDAQKGGYKFVGVSRIGGMMPKFRFMNEDTDFVDSKHWEQLKSKEIEYFDLT